MAVKTKAVNNCSRTFSGGDTTSRRRYSRLQLVVGVMLAAVVASLVSVIAMAAVGDAAGESSYVPLTPTRLLDTRVGFQVGDYDTPWPADTARSLTVTGTAGVPAAGVRAVVLNVTTVSPTAANSFLTVFPTGESMPTAASLNFVAGEIKNDVVIATVGAAGQIDIYNQLGTVDLVVDVAGYYTNTLEARVASIETLLGGLSRETVDGQDTLRLTNANLQLVNGTDTTYDTPNATGNLIIGYNNNFVSHMRTGSHNLIVGDDHGWTANGTAIFGKLNLTTGDGATVTGGTSNWASGGSSSVTGGGGNIASGDASSVTGGRDNKASGGRSSVGGGEENEASGELSVVVGGGGNGVQANAAEGERSVVVGGNGNTATGTTAVVASGSGNTASGTASIVSGGSNRAAAGNFDWVAGTLFEDS